MSGSGGRVGPAMRLIGLALVMGMASPAAAQHCTASSGDTVATWCWRSPTATSYTSSRLRLSRDDGGTFVDTAIDVEDACLTEAGAVAALADAPTPTLVVLGADGATSTAPIPLEQAYAVRSVGEALYVVGTRAGSSTFQEAWLIASSDGGASWADVASLPSFVSLGAFEADLHDGLPRLRIWSVEGLSCFGVVSDRIYVVEGGRVTTSMLRDDHDCAYEGDDCASSDVHGLGAHGSAYGLTHHESSDVQTVTLIQPLERVTATELRTDGGLFVGHNGRITLAVVGTDLVRLDGARARVLSRGLPEGCLLYTSRCV